MTREEHAPRMKIGNDRASTLFNFLQKQAMLAEDDLRKALHIEAAQLIEQQARRIEELEKINKLACEDWADDDTRVKELAKPFLTKFEIEGDSYGVPGVIDIVESLTKQLATAKAELHGTAELGRNDTRN